MAARIRVLVVDDSAFMRYAVSKHLSEDVRIEVVAVARDGMEALTKVRELQPDVITLDIQMPRMDGLTALETIMRTRPTPVVMLSSLTGEGTAETVRALTLGAVDFVLKPSGPISLDLHTVQEELAEKIVRASRVRVAPYVTAGNQVRSGTAAIPARRDTPCRRVVVIGSSTGGPRALHTLVPQLPADLSAAVVIVQHMPAGFTRSLAERLNELSHLQVQEARDGEMLTSGTVLVAPGDFHLLCRSSRRIVLTQDERVNGVRPSVDVAMETAAAVFGPAVVAVVLTGMGKDGAAGAKAVKAAGGIVIAEAESTSVVFGMPRSVIEQGSADHVLPLPAIAEQIMACVHHEQRTLLSVQGRSERKTAT